MDDDHRLKQASTDGEERLHLVGEEFSLSLDSLTNGGNHSNQSLSGLSSDWVG